VYIKWNGPGEPSTSTLADQDEPSTWPGLSGTEDTFVQAIDQVGKCRLYNWILNT
jgi:hypothetical protein